MERHKGSVVSVENIIESIIVKVKEGAIEHAIENGAVKCTQNCNLIPRASQRSQNSKDNLTSARDIVNCNSAAATEKSVTAVHVDVLILVILVHSQRLPPAVDGRSCRNICICKNEGGETGGVEEGESGAVDGEIENSVDFAADCGDLTTHAFSRNAQNALKVENNAVLSDLVGVVEVVAGAHDQSALNGRIRSNTFGEVEFDLD